MPNYFYFNASGQRQGPINDQQLQSLVAQKVITAQTQLETESGHKGLAGQIPGLNFPREQLNRQTYILLAVVGGWVGWHCTYAGYRSKMWVHFWLVIIGIPLMFLFGVGIILWMISQFIAVGEMFYEYDAHGLRMKE